MTFSSSQFSCVCIRTIMCVHSTNSYLCGGCCWFRSIICMLSTNSNLCGGFHWSIVHYISTFFLFIMYLVISYISNFLFIIIYLIINYLSTFFLITILVGDCIHSIFLCLAPIVNCVAAVVNKLSTISPPLSWSSSPSSSTIFPHPFLWKLFLEGLSVVFWVCLVPIVTYSGAVIDPLSTIVFFPILIQDVT